jgi:alpha-N-arabinofuranosidase
VSYDPALVEGGDWETGGGYQETRRLLDRAPDITAIFARHCETVRIANLAQMVNVIAPIFTSPDGLFLQTIYHPLKLCAEHMQEVVLDVYVACATHDLTGESSSWPHRVADLGPFKVLDVSATRDAAGRELALVVVNRNPEHDISTTVELSDLSFEGAATAYEVTGPGLDAINSFDRQPVGVDKRSVDLKKRSLDYSIPACSITVLRVGIAG